MEFRWTLTSGVDSELLTIDPVGWDAMQFELTRDMDYHGVFNSFTVDLQFLCKSGGGYDFINTRYESDGINAVIELLCEVSCGGGSFQTFFTGLLDMSTINRTDYLLGVKIDNNDLRKIVLDRDEVPVDMSSSTSIDGSALTSYTYGEYDLNLHSRTIELIGEIGYAQPITDVIDLGEIGATPIKYGLWMQNGYDLINGDLTQTNPNPEINLVQSGGGILFKDTGAAPFHEAINSVVEYPATFNVDYDFSGTFHDKEAGGVSRGCSEIQLNLYYGSDITNVQVLPTLVSISSYNTTSTDYTQLFSGSGSTTIELNYGDKVWIGWIAVGIGYGNNAGFSIFPDLEFDYTTAELTLQIDSDSTAEEVNSWAIHEAYSTVCESLSNQTSQAFYSEYLGRTNSQPQAYASNGCGAFLAITNGLRIRTFEEPLYITLDELFRASNAMLNLGLGFESIGGVQMVRVENKEYFYDTSNVLATFDNINEVRMTISQSLYYNGVKIGYQDWKPDEINGLEETNTIHEYSLPNVKKKNIYTAVSPYLTGGYAIEVTRRTKEATKDTTYDDNNFVIALSRSVDGMGDPDELDVAETDTNVTSSTGVPFISTVYNIEYTPTKMLLRHMNVLSGGIYKEAAAEVQFQSGEGNITAEIQLTSIGCDGDFSGANIAEDDSVEWDDTNLRQNQPLWIPEIYEFEYPLSITDWIAIKDNPNGVINFSRTEKDHISGFIVGLNYDVNRQLGQFSLLRAFV